MTHEQFWQLAFDSATASGHIFPAMAACEAALESAWGTSELARIHNNLFGMKQHVHPVFGTVNLPTKEWDAKKHGFVTINAAFVAYPSIRDCFADRMATLVRLAPKYPHYAAALAAKTDEEYIREVSATWSSDPERANKVLLINKARLHLL